MSAIALLLKNIGIEVEGSDTTESNITDFLISKGVKINFQQIENNITNDIDLIVYSSAIKEDNKEYKKAKELNINMLVRSKMLGLIMANYKNNINIAGTHGKTTTTSMISKLLIDANFNPTINVGAVFKYINGNIRIGDNNYFINEACEYTNSFLDFCPNIEIITNIEEDHLDFFKDINDIINSFKKFIDKLDEKGILIINKNIYNLNELIADCPAKIFTYGINENADIFAKNIKFDINSFYTFDLYYNEKFLSNINLNIIGKHNVENALATIALGLSLGIDIDIIKESLSSFRGADRRLENRGSFKGVNLYDDYAHHPNEIKASINSFKSILDNEKKFYLIFQPHTYTRTKSLFDDFVDVLSSVDNLIMVDIYAARENNIYNVSSKDVINKINEKYNKNAIYLDSFEKVVNYILKNVNSGDTVATMGAGDVFKICDILEKQLS